MKFKKKIVTDWPFLSFWPNFPKGKKFKNKAKTSGQCPTKKKRIALGKNIKLNIFDKFWK